jgi:acyl carrier protein
VIKPELELIVEEVSSVVLRVVKPSELLLSSRLLDSLGLVDVAVALERRFSLRIPNGDLIPDNFDSVEKIESYLRRRRDA